MRYGPQDETPEERAEREEFEWWLSVGKTILAAVVTVMAALTIFAWIAPDYRGPWIGLVLVSSFVVGGTAERLTR